MINFYYKILVVEFLPQTLNYIKETSLEYRKKLGQFFTPRSLREKILSKIPKLIKPKVLDPSCGTGEFLLSCKEYFVEPELYGFEIDKKLAEISKINIPDANIMNIDALYVDFEEKFDVIIGNPPYFEMKLNKELRSKYREIINGRVNIYALFIYLGIKLLKEGGYLGYVVSSSMNNGRYFEKLREFIIRNADIVYLETLENHFTFQEVNHTFQIIILRKGRNTGKYVFRNIFSEKAEELKEIFKNAKTLKELGYKVQTGKIVWNENKDKLTNNPEEGILLVWSHNIKNGKLELNNHKKFQYIKYPIQKADKGPAIVVKRIVGHPKRANLLSALIPPNTIFVAENHVNVIYPPPNVDLKEMEEIVKQLNSPKMQYVISLITGNTQISKRELESLVPINLEFIKDIKTRRFNTLKYIFPMENNS